MRTFENIVAQAAYLLWTYMPDAYAYFESGANTHVLVDYSPVLLANISAPVEVVDALAAATRSRPGTAWIVVTPTSVLVREAAITAYSRPLVTRFEAMHERSDLS